MSGILQRSVFIILLVVLPGLVHAQPGTFRDSVQGFSFAAPSGWRCEKVDAGYVMGSETDPGFVLILGHELQTLADMRREAASGIDDQTGTVLGLTGEVRSFGENGVAAEYEGFIHEAAVRAHAIGLLSRHGGGITILAGAPSEGYTAAHARLAEQIARTVKFFKPDVAGIVETWNSRLSGKKLTYLSSYTSGGSGGYSAQRVLSLCSGGSFSVSESSVVSVDVTDASGSGTGEEHGEGTWSIVVRSGMPALRLEFSGGSTTQYALDFTGGNLMLDGNRYFLTSDAACR